MGFWTGSSDKFKKISNLRANQEPLAAQATNAGLRPGAGGAFGDAADYYRNNLSDNPADMAAFAAPQMRQFREQTIPDIAEQFAGMGAGGLNSSGFQNSAIAAGTDLSERLGAIRANLRQQSAQGLQNIGQAGLQQFDENVFQPGTDGFLQSVMPAVGTALGSFAGPAGSAVGNMAGNWLSNSFGGNKVGQNSNPYGKAAMGATNAANAGFYGR